MNENTQLNLFFSCSVLVTSFVDLVLLLFLFQSKAIRFSCDDDFEALVNRSNQVFVRIESSNLNLYIKPIEKQK